jgi:hypothetical protein
LFAFDEKIGVIITGASSIGPMIALPQLLPELYTAKCDPVSNSARRELQADRIGCELSRAE